MSLGKKITIGIILGIAFGIFLRYFDIGVKPKQFKILGDIFLDLMKMTVVPLVFSLISSAILSIEDTNSMKKTVFKGVKLFVFTTFIGVLIGILVCAIIEPGLGVSIDLSHLDSGDLSKIISGRKTDTTFAGLLTNIIPSNIFKAAMDGDLLKIVFFTVILSASISSLKGKIHNGCVDFIHSFAKIMITMIKIVMEFAPFGIFGLVVWIAGSQDINLIHSLMKLVLTSIISIFILTFVFYPLMIIIRFRVNPIPFLKKMIEVQVFAIATGSSAASLPLNMKIAEEKIGISKDYVKLLMPIGATINMNGSGCSLAFYSIFVAQLYGIDLGIMQYITIAMMAFLGSIGNPPIPGGTIIMLSGVLTTLGYPLEPLSLIFAIDKIIGPIRTVGNVTGDAFAPLYLNLLDKKLDKKIYYK